MNFLKISYPYSGFLINRDQIFASVFYTTPKKVKSYLHYLSSIVSYQDDKILLFDLSSYLEDTFCLEEHEASPLLLIIKTDSLEEKNKEFVKSFYEKHKLDKILSNHYIALKIKSNTTIEELEAEDLRVPPGELLKHQCLFGVMGYRFPSKDSMEFWIDLEKIIFKELFTLRKKRDLNEDFNC